MRGLEGESQLYMEVRRLVFWNVKCGSKGEARRRIAVANGLSLSSTCNSLLVIESSVVSKSSESAASGCSSTTLRRQIAKQQRGGWAPHKPLSSRVVKLWRGFPSVANFVHRPAISLHFSTTKDIKTTLRIIDLRS